MDYINRIFGPILGTCRNLLPDYFLPGEIEDEVGIVPAPILAGHGQTDPDGDRLRIPGDPVTLRPNTNALAVSSGLFRIDSVKARIMSHFHCYNESPRPKFVSNTANKDDSRTKNNSGSANETSSTMICVALSYTSPS